MIQKASLKIIAFFVLVLVAPLQLPFIGTTEVSGIALNAFKDIFLLFLMLALLFVICRDKKLYGISSFEFTIIVILLGYMTLMFVISRDYKIGGAYYYKALFLCFVPVFSSLALNINPKTILSAMLKTMLAFLLMSLVVGVVRDSDFFDGVTSRHFLKFNLVVGFLFGYCCYINGVCRNKSTMLMLLALALLLLVMQRGAIICILVGLVAMHIKFNKYLFIKVPFLLALVAILVVIAANIPQVKEYAFYEAYGPRVIFNSLIEGSFSIDMIRDRGRIELINTIVQSSDISFFGNGFGTAKLLINASGHFMSGKEPHNDLLMLLVDIGILGVALVGYLLFLFYEKSSAMLSAISSKLMNQDKNSDGKYLTVLLMFSKGMLAGLMVWMTFSNVLIYMSSTFIYPMALICYARSYLQRKNKSCENKIGNSYLSVT